VLPVVNVLHQHSWANIYTVPVVEYSGSVKGMVAGKGDWTGRSTTDLVRELVRSGLDVDRGLVDKLLERAGEAIPYLAEILDEDKYWRLDEEAPGAGWAPISALHLLAAIAHPDGLEPILRVLHRRPDDLGDWLTEDIPSILGFISGSD